MKKIIMLALRIFVLIIASLLLMSGVIVVNDGAENTVLLPELPEHEAVVDTSPGWILQEFPPLFIPSKNNKVEEEIEPEEELYISLTDEEKLILATIVRLECGGSSYETQMAVASVVINRMNYWGVSLRDVVFAKNVFSTARHIDFETGKSKYYPYEKNWEVVEDICKNGPSIPYYVMYFRSKYFHTWATPYKQIGSLYFSYVKKYM